MNKFLIISTLIVFTSCNQTTQSDNSDQINHITDSSTTIVTARDDMKDNKEETSDKFECINFEFNSVEEQADSILMFFENATDSSLTNRHKWEHKFFCAFPKSFEEMQSIFGFDNKNCAAPLYSIGNDTHSYTNRHIGSDVIGFFSELKSIPDSVFYEKYTRINIDGKWQADNIIEAFGFHHRIINNSETGCKTLINFTDKELRSVFRFIFDGPHPKNEYNKRKYKKLKLEIKSQDNRLSQLLTESYEKLMAEDHRHH